MPLVSAAARVSLVHRTPALRGDNFGVTKPLFLQLAQCGKAMAFVRQTHPFR
jgi:hypothetical protein